MKRELQLRFQDFGESLDLRVLVILDCHTIYKLSS